MQKRDGHGETESYTESGEEEAKGGENVQKINREDVVQAALTVERWCKGMKDCLECPLYEGGWCLLVQVGTPLTWHLEKFLRARGLNNAD